MPFAEINNFKLYYEVHENVLPRDTFFVHGNMASARWWYPAIKELERRASRSLTGRAIIFDWRGSGRSSAPEKRSDLEMERLADDAIAMIRSMSDEKVDIVGHSAGGFISLLAMFKAPELFHRSLLLDPVGPNGLNITDDTAKRFSTILVNHDFLDMAIRGTIINEKDLDPIFFEDIIMPDAISAAKNNGMNVIWNLHKKDITNLIPKIETPTLVMHGDQDLTLEIEDSKRLAELLPNGVFVELKNQGHCLNVENPELFSDHLINHMSV